MRGARVAQPQSGGRRAGVLQPGGCAAAKGGSPGGSPGGVKGQREPPPKSEFLLNEWQLLARDLCGASREDVLDEALVVQPVACKEAALAARCPPLHPKDAISCRSYIVYNDAKKLLFWGGKKFRTASSLGKWCVSKRLYHQILLTLIKTWKRQAVHTHLCNTASNKL